MTIQTERLELVLLSPEELRLWTEDIAALEIELSCSYKAEPMTGLFLEIVKGQVKSAERDHENYLWHSFFFLIRRSDRTVVGSADFKSIPNERGEVEIGYGLGLEFLHNGYMTEAVRAMCEFALNWEGVLSVTAETDLDGFASQRVLERCGFEKYRQGETAWWRCIKAHRT